MRTLREYINESMIFEKQSFNKLSDILADKIIGLFKNEQFVDLPDIGDKAKDDSKTVKVENIKYKDKNVILYVSYSNEYNDEFLNEISLKGDYKNDAFILIKGDLENIDNTDDTLAHEIRHFYDELTGNGGEINNTYDENSVNKFEKFLYLISPTEQNAHTAGFRKWIKKDKNLTLLKNTYDALKSKDIDSFIEKFSTIMTNRRHEALKDKDSDDETQLKDMTININGKNVPADAGTENPVRLFEYKYYILDSLDSFKKYINTNLASGKERSDEDKKYIINHLAVLNDGDTDIDSLYKVILKKYNQTFNTFKRILENSLNK